MRRSNQFDWSEFEEEDCLIESSEANWMQQCIIIKIINTEQNVVTYVARFCQPTNLTLYPFLFVLESI